MAISDDFTVPAGQYPPFAVVTEDDHRAWIIITTALGLACALVFAGIRTFVRCAFTDGFGLDDAMVAASTVLYTIQSTIILASNSRGNGKSIDLLDVQAQTSIQREVYTAQILSVLGLGMSKLAIALLLHRLTPNEQQRRVFASGMIVCAVWTFASVFAVALQCDLSHPWITVGQTCGSAATTWQAVGAFDIITEIMLVGMSAYLVWDLKMIWQSKATVVFGFAVRLLIIVAIGLRLAAFDPIGLTTNPFLREDEFLIWMQAELCFANVSASIPTLRVFVNSLTTSYGGSGEKRTRSSNKDYSTGSQGSRRQRSGIMLSSFKVGSRSKTRQSATRSNLGSSNDEMGASWPAKTVGEAYDYNISGAGHGTLANRSQEASSKGGGGADAISVGSSESQQRMIIKKDITWEVQSERN